MTDSTKMKKPSAHARTPAERRVVTSPRPGDPVDEAFHPARVLDEREEGADHDAHHDDARPLTVLEELDEGVDRVDEP